MSTSIVSSNLLSINHYFHSDTEGFVKLIMDSSPDAVFVTDLSNERMVFANARFRDQLGIDEKDFLQQGYDLFHNALHEDELIRRKAILQDMCKAMSTEIAHHILRIQLKNGEMKWFSVRDRLLLNSSKTDVFLLLTICTDINDYKLAEKLINEKNKRLVQALNAQKQAESRMKEDAHFVNQITDAIPDVLFTMDLNTRQLTFTNRQVGKILGYSDHEIARMNNPIFDIMHPHDVRKMESHLDEMKATKDMEVVETEYRLIAANGQTHWFYDRNVVFKRNPEGTPVEKLGISVDITERKKMQQEMLEADLERKRHHLILQQTEEVSDSGSWEYDPASKQFLWSDGMYRLFNLPKGTPVRPEIYVTYAPADKKEDADRLVRKFTEEFIAFEEKAHISVNNVTKVLVVKARPFVDPDGRVRMLGVDHDITSQVVANNQVIALNQLLHRNNKELEIVNSELKTFNSIAANDYKETLRKLYTCLEYIIMHDARQLSNEGRANIRRGQAAIQKMKLLTDDIIAYSSIHAPSEKEAEVDVNEIIKRVSDNLADKILSVNATLKVEDCSTVTGFSTLLTLLFQNLFGNAIKFRKDNVPLEIFVACSVVAGKTIDHPSVISQATYRVITVSDNGVGFDNECRDKIFEMFYRAHDKAVYKGSGMGLSICRKIMDIHAGFMVANGSPGTGATFECYFPISGL